MGGMGTEAGHGGLGSRELPGCHETVCRQQPLLPGVAHHPVGMGLPSPCPCSPEMGPIPPLTPCSARARSKPRAVYYKLPLFLRIGFVLLSAICLLFLISMRNTVFVRGMRTDGLSPPAELSLSYQPCLGDI